MLVDDVDDLLAVIGELSLNLLLVLLESIVELGILGVLLDSSDRAAGGTLA